MKKNLFSTLFLLIILIIQIKSVDITLSSTMSDIEESTYIIKNNVLTLNSNSECKIKVAKQISATITLNSIAIDNSQTGPFVIKKEAIVNLIL